MEQLEKIIEEFNKWKKEQDRTNYFFYLEEISIYLTKLHHKQLSSMVESKTYNAEDLESSKKFSEFILEEMKEIKKARVKFLMQKIAAIDYHANLAHEVGFRVIEHFQKTDKDFEWEAFERIVKRVVKNLGLELDY